MKVYSVENENFGFQYRNAQWLLNDLPMASVRGRIEVSSFSGYEK